MARPRLVIAGAGGHGAEVSAYVQDIIARGWDGELLGFLDDAPEASATNHRVLGDLSAFANCPADFFREVYYLTALGSNPARRKVVERIESLYGKRISAWTLIHPSCHLGTEVEIGEGSCLAPGSIVT